MKPLSILKVAALAVSLVLVASCGTQRKAVKETSTVNSADTLQKQVFLQKVTDNAQHVRFITSKVKFSVEIGNRQMTPKNGIRIHLDFVMVSPQDGLLLGWLLL